MDVDSETNTSISPLGLLTNQASPEANDISINTLAIIVIGEKTSITARQEDIPDPPFVTFSKDIKKLNRVWDDSITSWSPAKCALEINGTKVPVKYWRNVYMYGKPGQRKGLKSRWGDWKVCPSVIVFIMFILIPVH